MSDLISRQAAIEALNERCESECEYSRKQRSIMCSACYLGSAKEVVEEQPTIEPKHGKWEWLSSTYDRRPCEMRFCCSECHHETIVHSNGLSQPWEKYCPNCGARMDL